MHRRSMGGVREQNTVLTCVHQAMLLVGSETGWVRAIFEARIFERRTHERPDKAGNRRRQSGTECACMIESGLVNCKKCEKERLRQCMSCRLTQL